MVGVGCVCMNVKPVLASNLVVIQNNNKWGVLKGLQKEIRKQFFFPLINN